MPRWKSQPWRRDPNEIASGKPGAVHTFGLARSTWTLALLARVAYEQGLSPTVLSIETIRQALRRLKVRWHRAKHWLTSSDPAYTRKKPA